MELRELLGLEFCHENVILKSKTFVDTQLNCQCKTENLFYSLFTPSNQESEWAYSTAPSTHVGL